MKGNPRVMRRMLTLGFLVAPLIFIFAPLIAAQAQTSDSELKLGIAAYKSSLYDEAIEHFQKAVDLDPESVNAHMYLATAHVTQFIPGVQTPDNLHHAETAIANYEQVLNLDAPVEAKSNSSKGIAYLYLNTKRFSEAKEYYQKATGFAPEDPEPYYSIGVIDWTQCYQPRMDARAKLGMAPEKNLSANDPEQKRVCQQLKDKNSVNIEDGIDSLNKAIQLRPDYDDAMAYMNLMYREKADLECDNPTARDEDLKTADHWVDETLRVKKMKAEKAAPAAAPTPQ
jgi:tetratricopeptide (TPR) repeat protein